MHKSRWQRLAGVVLGMSILLLTACGGNTNAPASSDSSNSASAASDTPATKEPVRITFVADFPAPAWVAQVPWVVAEAKGYYKAGGLDVTIQMPPTPDAPTKLVSNGNAQMTVSYTPDLLVGASEGLNLLAVGSLMDADNGGLMYWSDVIQTPEDLEGKTVAIYDIPLTKLHFKAFAQHHGIDVDTVKVVNAGDYSVPLMVSDQAQAADAAAASEYVVAPAEAKREAGFWVYQEDNGVPQRYWFVITANQQFAKDHPDAVKSFVKATLDGLAYAKDHPDEAIDLFVKKYPDLDRDLQKRAWDELAKYSFRRFHDGKPAGYMDVSIWEGYMKFLLDNGLLSKSVDLNTLVTNDYLPQP